MRSIGVLGCVVVLALGAAACGSDEPAPLPDWDFFGVVGGVSFHEPLVEGDGLYRGGPDSAYRSGAMTITLANGLVLEVPSGTPGGNWCRDLSLTGARDEECVLAGAFDESGTVAWFELLDVENTSQKLGGGRHVTVDGVERLDGDALIIRGLRFAVMSDVTVDCLGDVSTVADALESDRHLGLSAFVSIADETVTQIGCVYEL